MLFRSFYFEGIKRGTTNYKPDFLVTFPSGNSEWFEVKGFMDSKSKTKIKRMAKYYPNEKLNIVDKLVLKSDFTSLVCVNSCILSIVIQGAFLFWCLVKSIF